jgi:hypothetical protein
VEGVRRAYSAILIVVATSPLWPCTALAPKNPLKASELCGRAVDSSGQPIADFDLRLDKQDGALVAEAHTNSAGDFQFAPAQKGDYIMTTASKIWTLSWPVKVTSSKAFKSCSQPLIVQPALICGGSISKKGYHAKF